LEIFDGLYGTLARYWRVVDVILTALSLVIKDSFFTWKSEVSPIPSLDEFGFTPKGFIKIPMPFPNRG